MPARPGAGPARAAETVQPAVIATASIPNRSPASAMQHGNTRQGVMADV